MTEQVNQECREWPRLTWLEILVFLPFVAVVLIMEYVEVLVDMAKSLRWYVHGPDCPLCHPRGSGFRLVVFVGLILIVAALGFGGCSYRRPVGGERWVSDDGTMVCWRTRASVACKKCRDKRGRYAACNMFHVAGWPQPDELE